MNEDLLIRYCQKECTQEETARIEKEMKTSKDICKQVENIRLSLAIAHDIQACEAIPTAAAYKKTWEKIEEKQKRKNKIIPLLMRYAAILAIPLAMSTVLFSYLYFSSQLEETQYAEVKSPAGAILKYELPDKSIVWLNAESKLRYPTRFAKGKREVELEGEAYFEVEANKKRPFYVHTTSGISIYVYGTKFNINAYNDQSYVETVLEKGKVNVILPDQNSVLRMRPNDQFYYNKATKENSLSKVDVYEKTAWKDGKLIFRDASLESIMKRLARHHNVEITIHNHLGKEYRYRATFKNERLTDILDYLSKSTNLKWKIEEAVQQKNGTFSKKKISIDVY